MSACRRTIPPKSSPASRHSSACPNIPAAPSRRAGRERQRHQRKVERVARRVSCRQSARSAEARRLRTSHDPCSDAAKRRHDSGERAHLRPERIAGRNLRRRRSDSDEAHQDRPRSGHRGRGRFRHRPRRPHRGQSARLDCRTATTCIPNKRRPRNDRAPGVCAQPPLLLAATAIYGCDLAPDYQVPPTPVVPASFKETGPWTTATPEDTLPKGAWWTAL